MTAEGIQGLCWAEGSTGDHRALGSLGAAVLCRAVVEVLQESHRVLWEGYSRIMGDMCL